MIKKIKINPKVISIVLKPQTVSDFNSILPNLFTFFKKRKKQIQFLDSEENRLKKIFRHLPPEIKLIRQEHLQTSSNLIITLGGDGTFIGVARKCTRNNPPIFGVNMGRLGFITEFSKSELFKGLGQIFQSEISVQRIHLFKIEIFSRGKKIIKDFFLNDAVFNKNDLKRMIDLNVETQHEHIFGLSGDGLIISSPIGSTAYSLAAGGPIVHPNNGAMILTPICPHGLTNRPLVISDKEKIIVKNPLQKEELSLTLDGQVLFSIKSKQWVEITKGRAHYFDMVKNPERSYFRTLKEKFVHGKRSTG